MASISKATNWIGNSIIIKCHLGPVASDWSETFNEFSSISSQSTSTSSGAYPAGPLETHKLSPHLKVREVNQCWMTQRSSPLKQSHTVAKLMGKLLGLEESTAPSKEFQQYAWLNKEFHLGQVQTC